LTYLGFITEGKLVAVLITPSLGVPNWPVIYIINIAPPRVAGEACRWLALAMLWWVLDDGVTMTRFRRTRRARGFDRRRRLLPEVSGRGDWRGACDGKLRSRDDYVDSLWLRRGKGVREMIQRKEKRLGGEGSSAVAKSSGGACRYGGVRRDISRRPCDGFEERQREMREDVRGYLKAALGC
jgi:hypothetical protein